MDERNKYKNTNAHTYIEKLSAIEATQANQYHQTQ